MNTNTLLYWHKLEHFYPYILEEQHDKYIKSYYISEASDFPDYSNTDISDDMFVRYYEIYLGIFKVDSALKVLKEKMHADKEFHDESDETSCFCKIRVRADGTFRKDSFKVSSFPWAIQRIKENQINLEQWDDDFQMFQREFYLRFFQCHKIITYEVLENILAEVKEIIGWDIRFDDCWLRIDRVIGKKRDFVNLGSDGEEKRADEESDDIELEDKRVDELIKANDLLNSFYVRDLERIITQIFDNDYGEGLNKYVDHSFSADVDIENDKVALLNVFNPKYLPFGKWPSGFPLRAMQQVAVNLAVNEELYPENIFSVNGPPGTGKTTLLRDIIAAQIVERAIRLIELDKPDDVFEDTIGSITYKGYTSYVKRLKPQFREGGILVASNNNTAVENISTELPEKKSIHVKYHLEYQYFSKLSNRVLNKDTWGMISAKLGNRKNCSEFINDFWPFDNKPEENAGNNFNLYLKEIHCNSAKRTEVECVEHWKKAKDRFLNVYQQINEMYADMQKCYDAILKEQQISKVLDEEKQKHENLRHELDLIKKDLEFVKEALELERALLNKKLSLKEKIKKNTLFFWIKYIFTSKLNHYKQTELEIQQHLVKENELDIQSDNLQSQLLRKKDELDNQKAKVASLVEEIKQCGEFVGEWSKNNSSVIPEEKYISALVKNEGEERDDAQKRSPWNGEKIVQLREQIFLEAMNLHRVFVENSPTLRVQLDVFNKLMRNMINKEDAMKFTTPLIQSFQLVVPVMSSTFASVGGFLKYAQKDTFGLLLIDEAGQAVPQSAVGAIWRSKKSVVVGDPLQIEPVVTIHDKTIQFLKGYFLQSDLIASKETSVQTLADRCNSYGGWREYEEGRMWIGSPLLVHGRCQRDIFNIANTIAYNRKMIYGTKDKDIISCKWKHVAGDAVDKHYVPKQAEAILEDVLDAFYKARNGNCKFPSLFIITPFKSVKAGLIRYFSKDDFLYNKIYNTYDKDESRALKSWLYKNIGTIHTFQGKEADKVIVCLGVANSNYGAVQWASQRPNILNVAITRAKDELYIVGDKNIWGGQPYFREAYSICIKQEDELE